MLARLRPRSAYDVMAALSLFLVLAGGTAYAANTVFSTDIVDGEVRSPDLAGAAVTNSKLAPNSVAAGKVIDNSLGATDLAPASVGTSEVANNTLQGADIQDQSGVDTCVSTVRVGQLCVRAENQPRWFDQALRHCANLDLRLPSLSEAMELVVTHDIANVDEGEFFWTGNFWLNGSSFQAGIVTDSGAWNIGQLETPFETVCVTTPTN